ncbi:hypothetical protein Syun_025786 [Stephania yunnanensis]|uniref:NADH-quinone oxidoreductase subunit D domain-containing protein n=1 Tax=Stephania yunnanensis TaxID=152371 RepID=A0AAP0ET28_9MAGN
MRDYVGHHSCFSILSPGQRSVQARISSRKSNLSSTASFIRPGGVAQDLPLGSCRDIDSSTQQFASRIDESEEMSIGNRIWKQRLVDIGFPDPDKDPDPDPDPDPGSKRRKIE